jgi:AsmA family protein
MAKANIMKWVGGIIAAAIFLPILVLGVLIATFDANKYRDDIAKVLSEQTGRTVNLAGAMNFSISAGGAVLAIDDVTIANPEWASRKEMAKIGHLELAVAIAPLLNQKLKIDRFVLSNADIQLERSTGGKGNWEFKPTSRAATANAAKDEVKAAQKIQLAMEKVTVRDTRLAFRDAAKGGTTEVKLANLDLTAATETLIKGAGQFRDKNFALDLSGGSFTALTEGKEWPFELSADFADNKVAGNGVSRQMGKQVNFEQITITAAPGQLNGNLQINSAGARPSVKGELNADKLEVKAAAAPAAGATADVGTAKHADNSGRMFSDAPIDFSALKSVDANITLKINQLVLAAATLDQIVTTINLNNGNLSLKPVNFLLAGNPMEARVGVNANTPQVAIALKGDNVDSNSVLKLFNLDKMVLGRANIDLDVTGQGSSAHAIASSLNGSMALEVGKGEIPVEGMREMAGGLMRILLPGSENVANASLTCISSRFDVQNGVATAKGLLIDTNLVTVAGNGAINLRDENISMMLKPLPKQKSLLDTAVPLRISGPLNNPGFNLDATGVAQTAASKLLGVDLGGKTGGLQVPMVDATAPGNPCTIALTNPVYAQPEQKPGVMSPGIEKTKQAVQEKAKGLMDDVGKSLGGIKLFGN